MKEGYKYKREDFSDERNLDLNGYEGITSETQGMILRFMRGGFPVVTSIDKAIKEEKQKIEKKEEIQKLELENNDPKLSGEDILENEKKISEKEKEIKDLERVEDPEIEKAKDELKTVKEKLSSMETTDEEYDYYIERQQELEAQVGRDYNMTDSIINQTQEQAQENLRKAQEESYKAQQEWDEKIRELNNQTQEQDDYESKVYGSDVRKADERMKEVFGEDFKYAEDMEKANESNNLPSEANNNEYLRNQAQIQNFIEGSNNNLEEQVNFIDNLYNMTEDPELRGHLKELSDITFDMKEEAEHADEIEDIPNQSVSLDDYYYYYDNTGEDSYDLEYIRENALEQAQDLVNDFASEFTPDLGDLVDNGYIEADTVRKAALDYVSIDDIKQAMRYTDYSEDYVPNDKDALFNDPRLDEMDLARIGDEVIAGMSSDEITDMINYNGWAPEYGIDARDYERFSEMTEELPEELINNGEFSRRLGDIESDAMDEMARECEAMAENIRENLRYNNDTRRDIYEAFLIRLGL